MKRSLDNDLNEAYETFHQDHGRLRERLMASVSARWGQRKHNRLINLLQLFIRGDTMNVRMTKLAAAAAIVTIVFVGLHWLGGAIDGATVAWADVLKNVETARTVMFIREFESSKEKEMVEIRIMEPYHSRTDVIAHQSQSQIDETGTGTMYKVAIRNTKLNKHLLLYPNTKMALIGDDDVSPGDEIRAYERLKKDFRDGTEKNLGRIKLNGRETICFEISQKTKKITVWADPDTALPIQIEEISEENGDSRKVLMSGIKFDIEFDEQLFSLTPPADYCFLDFETQQLQTPFKLTEKHLIEGLAVYPKYLDGKFCTRYGGGRPLSDEVRKKCKAEVKKIESWSDIEAHKSTLGCAFVEQLPEGSDYQYVGEDVKLGDANTPVCWWKPPGSKTYRVVYGDLSIRDVEPSALPKIPWLTEQK